LDKQWCKSNQPPLFAGVHWSSHLSSLQESWSRNQSEVFIIWPELSKDWFQCTAMSLIHECLQTMHWYSSWSAFPTPTFCCRSLWDCMIQDSKCTNWQGWG
jgi:hypothetical protein